LLTDEEIATVYDLNSIDKQIYDYVKDNPKWLFKS
jgi:5-bromo-4-chloroindolyl phosphate hydrolysis protein